MPVTSQKEVKKLDWKHVLALVLNLFIWPGTGTLVLGKSKLGLLQMLAYLISAILVLSGGFGISESIVTILGLVGVLSFLASWTWSAYTVIAELHSTYS